MRSLPRIAIAPGVCLLAGLAAVRLLPSPAAARWLPPAFHRGVCVEGGPRLEEAHVRELLALGVTHVSLNLFGWMEAPDVPEVRVATGRRGGAEGRWWGESGEGLRQYAALARRHGLSVMLRPHLWLRKTQDRAGRSGLWLADVEMQTPEEWQRFFASYRELCLHYARLAEEAGIEWYSVGAELTRTTLTHPDEWRRLIAEVREVYRGRLTYSANWWAEVEGIELWDALDAIGVQAYYPLASGPAATEEELLAAWRPHLASLGRLAERFGRPVLFTEIGYRATADAAVRPWEWSGAGGLREDVQARAYRAALRAVESAPFVAGMYWWKYHVAAPREIRAHAGHAEAQGFSWQGREAEAVLGAAYQRRERP
jgi:hypothetical protein